MRHLRRTILTCLVFLTTPFLHAQIVYTDIDPDSTLSATVDELWKSYFLDLDNDGTFEFEIEHFHPEPSYQAVEIHRNTVGTQQVIINSGGHSRVMTKGENIDAGAGTWGLDGYGILNAPWYGGEDKYFAIRFQINGAWHYGWARVSIPADAGSFTIKDYAYESTPGKAIECGDAGTTTVRTPPQASGISVQQSGSRILITSTRGATGSIFIHNILGMRVISGTLEGERTAVELSALPSGVYMLAVEGKGALLYVQKVLHRRETLH